MSKSLARARTIAYTRQSGGCFYCGLAMWLDNPLAFASKYGITLGQAKRFQCTGEHLEARQDGGTAFQSNIVAACSFCNQHRHRRKKPPTSNVYKQLVCKRMSQGRWHHHWSAQIVFR